MSWTAFSWSRWLEIRSPRFYPWFSYQLGMWPWASHESKSTIKESYNALHMPGALWSYTAFLNTIYYLNLPHSILRGVWQLLTIPVIESRNLRPRDTKSLLISIFQMSGPETDIYDDSTLVFVSFPMHHTTLLQYLQSWTVQYGAMSHRWWYNTWSVASPNRDIHWV